MRLAVSGHENTPSLCSTYAMLRLRIRAAVVQPICSHVTGFSCMRTLVFILMLCPSISHASQWFCEEEAAVRTENVLKVCGIGESKEEGPARLKAYRNARWEFLEFCNSSSDCIDHFYYAKPLRTECVETDKGYKCHRLVEFTIGGPAYKGSTAGH